MSWHLYIMTVAVIGIYLLLTVVTYIWRETTSGDESHHIST
jgi:hypothetical protein